MPLKPLLIQQLIAAVMLLLSPEVLKRAVDALLKVIEDAVVRSENKLDDVVILALCRQIRLAFDIPDD